MTSAQQNKTGLYQFKNNPQDRLCVDCAMDVIFANDTMVMGDWIPATIGDFDAECCDTCDCIPAAEGKALVFTSEVR